MILCKVIISPWASYQIRKIAGCACAGNAGNVFPRRRFQRKPLVSDPGMHHGTCVTHVPWCMSGSLTRGDGENVPGIPGACAPAILRIWQEAHCITRVFPTQSANNGQNASISRRYGWVLRIYLSIIKWSTLRQLRVKSLKFCHTPSREQYWDDLRYQRIITGFYWW